MVLSDHWFAVVCEFVLSFNQNRRLSFRITVCIFVCQFALSFNQNRIWSFRITGLFLCASLCCPLTRTGDCPFGSLVCICVLVCVVLQQEQEMVLSNHWFVFVCYFLSEVAKIQIIMVFLYLMSRFLYLMSRFLYLMSICLYLMSRFLYLILDYFISYLRVYPWALRLYHPEGLLYSLRRSRRLYSGAEGWYNLNAHGQTRR